MVELAIQLLGSLVYRTYQALKKDPDFIHTICQDSSNPDPLFSLNYYVGERQDILSLMKQERREKEEYQFSLLNIEPYTNRGGNPVNFDLALTGSVSQEKYTEEEEKEFFIHLLRPVYTEFMQQLTLSSYCCIPQGVYPSHNYYEIYSTGENGGFLLERYGERTEAIEIHQLKLPLKSSYTTEEREIIGFESRVIRVGNNQKEYI